MTDALPIIAGHQIRIAFRVGNTDVAFDTICAAIDYAGEFPVTFAELTAEYNIFNLENSLHLGAADEHLFDERLTDEQRLWLVDFCRRWKSVELNERAIR